MYVMPGFIDMHGHIGGTARVRMLNMCLNFGWRMALPRFVIHLQAMVSNGHWNKSKKARAT